MLDFDTVQAALERLGANTDAAESHGTLCGLMITQTSLMGWLAHTLDEMPDRGNVLASEQMQVLETLFEQTRDQLNDDDLNFELLLPDDADDFGLRLLGLSGWCQGFLYGIGATGAVQQDELDETARECLSDLLEISKLSHDEEGSDEAELQFAEIVEHVRMATLMLNETLNPLKPDSTLH
jgi:uncharacterized protein